MTAQGDAEALAAAIRRIEESRALHLAWAEHLPTCDHCQTYPPEYIQTTEEHLQIVAEYDAVLAILRGLPARDASQRQQGARDALERAADAMPPSINAAPDPSAAARRILRNRAAAPTDTHGGGK